MPLTIKTGFNPQKLKIRTEPTKTYSKCICELHEMHVSFYRLSTFSSLEKTLFRLVRLFLTLFETPSSFLARNLSEGAPWASCSFKTPEKSRWTRDIHVSTHNSATKTHSLYTIMFSAHPFGKLFHHYFSQTPRWGWEDHTR